jgi:release factor glutamine methyltransferase
MFLKRLWQAKNAVINQVDVTFIEQNILETADLNQQFDIIVSNPPYVRNLEKQEIKKNVLDNEPHLALFVEDDDALIFFIKNSSISTEKSLGNGQLYFEINQYLGKTWSLCLKS